MPLSGRDFFTSDLAEESVMASKSTKSANKTRLWSCKPKFIPSVFAPYTYHSYICSCFLTNYHIVVIATNVMLCEQTLDAITIYSRQGRAPEATLEHRSLRRQNTEEEDVTAAHHQGNRCRSLEIWVLTSLRYFVLGGCVSFSFVSHRPTDCIAPLVLHCCLLLLTLI